MSNTLWHSFSLLRQYPIFARFWVAQTISMFGDTMTFIALPWFVLQVTGSGTATAGVLLSLQLPAIVTGMVAGSLIDRYQPRTILAVDNVLRAVIVAFIPLLYWLEWLEIWHIFLLALLTGMLKPVTLVGSRTIIPELVEDSDLDPANMLWSFSVNLTMVIGPAVAGLLVAAMGGAFVLLLDAGTYIVMALVAATLPAMLRAGSTTRPPLLERLGLQQLWNLKVVRATTLLSLVFFFSYGPLEAALPLYSDTVLRTDARGYGLLWTSLGLGALVGTLGSVTVGRYIRLGLALPLISLLWGASLLPMVVFDDLWLACAFLALGGLMWGPYTPLETTLLQRTVAKEQLGRVFGARSTLLTTGGPLGLAVGGVMLAFLPSTTLIALSGVACILVGLGGLASPTLRTLTLPSGRSRATLVDEHPVA